MSDIKIAVLGLGYVGLPLAVEFGKHYPTVGYDIKTLRVSELKNGVDNTLEVESKDLKSSPHLLFTEDIQDIKDCNHYIVTVPTPIDEYKYPNLAPLLNASKDVATVLSPGDTVIYESTVYPGCTEEDCVPVLEKHSGLEYNKDFFCGYSPERMNPGDKEHGVKKIVKVTSGSNEDVARRVDNLYKKIVDAGTHMASSIMVAEASKVIENTQRDLNIAFVNELAIIFNKLGINTSEVLEAAATKWNFLHFKPGLVGGHCIGVDPYYLTHKATAIDYHPEIILAGRRLNDNMGKYVAGQMIKQMIHSGIAIKGSRVLVLGITFKENCPDIRNSKVIDCIRELQAYSVKVQVYDPWADPEEVKDEYDIDLLKTAEGKYDGILLAVAHNEFLELSLEQLKSGESVVYDIKAFLAEGKADFTL